MKELPELATEGEPYKKSPESGYSKPRTGMRRGNSQPKLFDQCYATLIRMLGSRLNTTHRLVTRKREGRKEGRKKEARQQGSSDGRKHGREQRESSEANQKVAGAKQ